MSDNSDFDMEYDSTGGYEDDEDGIYFSRTSFLYLALVCLLYHPSHIKQPPFYAVMGSDSNDLSSNEDAGSDFNVVPSAARSNKKLYEVDYTVLDEDDLSWRQEKEIKHVAGIIGIETKDAALILRYFGWNKDLLMDKYMVGLPLSI